MKDFVDVNTGEVVVCRGKSTLRAFAMGSCIAVAAYDAAAQIAGMAHIMLPWAVFIIRDLHRESH